MADTGNNTEIFDRKRRRLVRDRAFARREGQDFLSNLMADEILERLSLVKREFRNCLIIGLPATKLSTELKKLGIKTITADISHRIAASLNGVQCDEDRLPLADNSFDLILNIGALDTVNDLPGALALTRRVLEPDGLFLAAFVGAESLPVLKSVLMESEEDKVSAHIHPQIDIRSMGDLMTRMGFALPVVDSDSLDVRYASVGRLVEDIRDCGGSNVLTASVSKLERKTYKKVIDQFQSRAEPDDKVSERIEIIYLSGWAPHPDQPKPARRGSGQISLKTALKDKSER